jgi:hypothetical protein
MGDDDGGKKSRLTRGFPWFGQFALSNSWTYLQSAKDARQQTVYPKIW